MTVESVLFFPVVLMIVLIGFHLAALMHAHHVGAVAASRGASLMARSIASHGNVTRVIDEINRVTKEMGGVPSRGLKVTESLTHFEVTVSLSSPQIVPFLPASVHRTATSAKEFFIEEQDR